MYLSYWLALINRNLNLFIDNICNSQQVSILVTCLLFVLEIVSDVKPTFSKSWSDLTFAPPPPPPSRSSELPKLKVAESGLFLLRTHLYGPSTVAK